MQFYTIVLTLLCAAQDRLETREGGNDRGATAVEYGLMVALIAAIIVFAVGFLGIEVRETFERVTEAIKPG